MEKEKEYAIQYIRHFYKKEISELGKSSAHFLHKMWGIYNLNSTSLRKVNFSEEDYLEVVINKCVSTVDNADLTRIVAYAHEMMLRVSIEKCAPGYIKIGISQRANRNFADGSYKWWSNIQDHLSLIIKK